MKYKSLIARSAIILILTLSFVNSYNKTSYLVYADTTTDEWTSVTTNEELAEAFRYYCKSRNLVIEGSVLDGVTSFTTTSFNNICNTLGIDVTALQAHLKRSTDSNGNLQFLFDQFGVTAFNRIFAELLQNNNLDVGDQVDEVVFTGEYVKDADGYGAFVYVVNSSYTSSSVTNNNGISAVGTVYKYSTYDIVQHCSSYGNSSSIPLNFKDKNGSKSMTIRQSIGTSTHISNNISNYTQGSALIYYRNNVGTYYNAHMAIFRMGQTYYVGVASNKKIDDVNNSDRAPTIVNGIYTWNFNTSLKFVPVESTSGDIIFNTYNQTINSNTYNDNKQTVINNNGDVNNYDYDDDDPPVNPPSGGGGDTNNVDIDLPNFNFNIPDIDFSLKGLTDKFPFCIPFDMVALLQLLNAEPQAPRIQGQIPFGSFYTWNLDLDFSRFNDFAVIMRGLEFVGFIFFLIASTINIAKG